MTAIIKVRSDPAWGNGVELRMAFKNADNSLSIAQPVTFETMAHGSFSAPMLCLEREEAQYLMDELWNCGIRPTEGTGSAGSLAATQAHLKDLQAINARLLDSALAPPIQLNPMSLGEPVPGVPGWYVKP